MGLPRSGYDEPLIESKNSKVMPDSDVVYA